MHEKIEELKKLSADTNMDYNEEIKKTGKSDTGV